MYRGDSYATCNSNIHSSINQESNIRFRQDCFFEIKHLLFSSKRVRSHHRYVFKDEPDGRDSHANPRREGEKREEKKFPRVESHFLSLFLKRARARTSVFRTDDLHEPIIYFRGTHEERHRVMQIARMRNLSAVRYRANKRRIREWIMDAAPRQKHEARKNASGLTGM